MKLNVTYNSFDHFIFSIDSLHPQDVIAEVQGFEPALLAQQGDDGAACPVQAFSEHLFNGELGLAYWDAVQELEC